MIRKTALELKQDKLLIKFGYKQKPNKKKAKKKKEAIDKVNRLKRMPYFRFLKTKYWKNVRVLVLKRDGYKCVICNDTKYLQVHHDTYKHHGDELNHLKDLMTLCRSCHKEHHFAQ